MVKASPLGNATCDLYFDQWMDQIDKLNIYNIYGQCFQSGPKLDIKGLEVTDASPELPRKRGYTDWLTDHIGLSSAKYGKGLP